MRGKPDEKDMDPTSIESCIRGYHNIYKDIWNPQEGEKLVAHKETHNWIYAGL